MKQPSPRSPRRLDGQAPAEAVIDIVPWFPTRAQVITAIETLCFKVVYQPIVDIQQDNGSFRTVGHEALSRFVTGSPPDWFAAATQAGLRIELELAAIRLAISGYASTPVDQFLALNTSLETLLSPDLIPALDGIPPERLLLELPEDTVITDYERTKVVIDRLTGLGYRLAMDDLAKGRIDLWYLVRLRPAIVKVDISMIRDIDLDPSKQSLVNGLRLLGEVLRAEVVAEGIERKGELDRLQSLGVRYGQGFLLGRPGPLENPPTWLQPKWLDPEPALSEPESPPSFTTASDTERKEPAHLRPGHLRPAHLRPDPPLRIVRD